MVIYDGETLDRGVEGLCKLAGEEVRHEAGRIAENLLGEQ